MMESIEKLREWSRLFDGMYVMEEGDICHIYNRPLTDSMKSWGELMREQCGEIEREIAERYMELPVDADGVPIRCGDEVTADTLGNGKWSVFAVASDYWVDVDGYTHKPCETHHVKPRTIEDVLRDLVNGIDRVEFDVLTAIGEAADEIRELMEVDR